MIDNKNIVSMSNINNPILKKAIMEFLKSPFAFYGEYLLFMKFIPNNNLKYKTMGVTIDNHLQFVLHYDEKFIQETPFSEILFILMHEVSHCIFLHLLKSEKYNDHLLCNIAQDMVINTYLKEHILNFIQYYNMINLENFSYNITPPDHGLFLSKDYSGPHVFEYVYDFLLQDPNNSQKICVYNNGNPADFSKLQENYAYDDHLFWDAVKNLPPELLKHLSEDIFNRLKHRGLVTNNLSNDLDNLKFKKPKSNVLSKLKHKLNTTLSSQGYIERTYKKLNRRLPMVLKGKALYTSNINVLLDTSGSMCGEFEKVLSYLLTLTSEYTLYQCDTELKSITKLKSKKDIFKIKISGLGGTELMPAIDLIKNKNIPLLIMTDGYTDTLNLKPFNQVFILTSSDVPKISNYPKKMHIYQISNEK